MLIVFGGLPGVGKTTLARGLARRVGAVYLRIDTIEHALIGAGIDERAIGASAYAASCGVAGDNLGRGLTVIVDAVNALGMARDAWREAARAADVPLLEIEVVCSDRDAHRRRIDARLPEMPGRRVPDWKHVTERRFEPWPSAHVFDTAGREPQEVLTALADLVARCRGHG